MISGVFNKRGIQNVMYIWCDVYNDDFKTIISTHFGWNEHEFSVLFIMLIMEACFHHGIKM